MENFKYFVLFLCAMFATILFVLFWRDSKADYSKQNLGDKVRLIKGQAYLIVPYYFWQAGKVKEIRKRYSESYSCNDRKYLVEYLDVGAQYEFDDVLISSLHRMAKGKLILQETLPKESPITVIQAIGRVYGTANLQGEGHITSYNITNVSSVEIVELINKIIPSLDHIQDVPKDIIDDVRDDLDSVTEQISSDIPKKNRIQKALTGIKKFVSDCGMKLAVNWATGKVEAVDWAELIEKIERFISGLG